MAARHRCRYSIALLKYRSEITRNYIQIAQPWNAQSREKFGKTPAVCSAAQRRWSYRIDVTGVVTSMPTREISDDTRGMRISRGSGHRLCSLLDAWVTSNLPSPVLGWVDVGSRQTRGRRYLGCSWRSCRCQMQVQDTTRMLTAFPLLAL
jgi:hypothetical protein